MKTFRMIGMALAAVLLCVNLTSCDKDDDELTGDPTSATISEKKLAKAMKYRIEDGYKQLSESIEFIYGENGNIVKTIEEWKENNSWNSETYEHIWESKNSFTLHWDEEEYDKFIFNDGRVTKQIYVEGNNKYTYYLDYNKGHLKEYEESLEEGDRNTCMSLSWSNDQLVSAKEWSHVKSFLYDKQICKKGFFPLQSYYIEELDYFYIFMAQPELVGLRTAQLPSQMIEDYSTTTFEYEFDSEGYVIGCTTCESREHNTPTNRYWAFFWE